MHEFFSGIHTPESRMDTFYAGIARLVGDVHPSRREELLDSEGTLITIVPSYMAPLGHMTPAARISRDYDVVGNVAAKTTMNRDRVKGMIVCSISGSTGLFYLDERSFTEPRIVHADARVATFANILADVLMGHNELAELNACFELPNPSDPV